MMIGMPLRVDVDEQCTVYLCTQSYQRLHMMERGAKQAMEIHLKRGAPLSISHIRLVPTKIQFPFTQSNLFGRQL